MTRRDSIVSNQTDERFDNALDAITTATTLRGLIEAAEGLDKILSPTNHERLNILRKAYTARLRELDGSRGWSKLSDVADTFVMVRSVKPGQWPDGSERLDIDVEKDGELHHIGVGSLPVIRHLTVLGQMGLVPCTGRFRKVTSRSTGNEYWTFTFGDVVETI